MFNRLNFAAPPNHGFMAGSGNVPIGTGYDVENAVLNNLLIPVYKCPSSPASAFNVATSPVSNNGTASPNASLGKETGMTMDYVGIAGAYASGTDYGGTCTQSWGTSGSMWCDNGILVIRMVNRMRDVTDGTSNTLLIGEQSGLIGGLDYRSNYYGAWTGFIQEAAGNPPGTAAWGTGLHVVRTASNPAVAPTTGNQTYLPNTPLTSAHSGGIHGLMADGSVRFLSDNISMESMRRIAAKADGLVVGEF